MTEMTLKEIAQLTDGELVGDDAVITELSSLDSVITGSLVFIDNNTRLANAEASGAAAIIVPEGVTSSKKPIIRVKQPKFAFAMVMQQFVFQADYKPGVDPRAIVAEDAQIDASAYVGPGVVIESGTRIAANCRILAGCYIGSNVVLDEHCVIQPNVTIYHHTEIGKRVEIHAGTVIGTDGFGYVEVEGEQHKIPQIGNVVIHDDVEIGSNTVIDRAALGSTVIGKGTKIDNHVHIAHAVKLGKNNIICGFSGLAGSSTTGDNVVLAAGVGVADHVKIGDNVVLTGRSAVPTGKKLAPNTRWFGAPARPEKFAIEQYTAQRRLPALMDRVDELERKLAELQK